MKVCKCGGVPFSHFLIFALSQFLILIFPYSHITLATGDVLLPPEIESGKGRLPVVSDKSRIDALIAEVMKEAEVA